MNSIKPLFLIVVFYSLLMSTSYISNANAQVLTLIREYLSFSDNEVDGIAFYLNATILFDETPLIFYADIHPEPFQIGGTITDIGSLNHTFIEIDGKLIKCPEITKDDFEAGFIYYKVSMPSEDWACAQCEYVGYGTVGFNSTDGPIINHDEGK